MPLLFFRAALLLSIVGAHCFLLPARAQNYLDLLGVTALRAVTTNLNGAGVRVAQVEAGDGSVNYWQVNPGYVGQPTNHFTYICSNGTSSTFTNSLGLESGHADSVGGQFYGMASGLATNVLHIDNFEANYFLTHYVFSVPTRNSTNPVVNQSFAFLAVSAATQQSYDSTYDNYSVAYKTLFISPANNAGISASVTAPGTAYNCICVGACLNGLAYNSIGPTIDNGRCKPDITALADATSFSTPQVSGAAAVMLQGALRGDGGTDTNSAADMRTLKALLLNGAIKPADWTNSPLSPLDARYGSGILNLLNAYQQLAGGKNNYLVSNSVSLNAAHPPTGAAGTIVSLRGWNFSTNISGKTLSQYDTIHHYYFNVTNAMSSSGFMATATLVWNRQSGQTSINNLDLFLYNCANSNLVTCSTSRVDNVEHLYIANLPQGRYDLQVWKAGGSTIVSGSEPYALAWEFVQRPVLAISRSPGKAALAWPAYPAGFWVESGASLAAGSWTTNGIPSTVITNGTNQVQLTTTNAGQYFRLRRP